ncbi:MAG TPA: hypothetical protein VFE22_01525 [Edaphobacter sp.]|jgi:hypothetical protein|nr:hypothetical protein [Edaphobacter sp.]
MSEQLEGRLKSLEMEFETGKKMLAELETRESELRGTLLRISGAIQVLREFVPPVEGQAEPSVNGLETPATSAVAN